MTTPHVSGNVPWPSVGASHIPTGLENIEDTLDAQDATQQAQATLIDENTADISTISAQVATLGGGSVDPVAARAAIGAASLLMPPNPQPGNYTLAASDATGGAVLCTSATAKVVTIPLHSAVPLPPYCMVPVIQFGAGVVTVVGASGVTVLAPPTGYTPSTSGQNSWIVLYQVSQDVWMVQGQLGTTLVAPPATARYTDPFTAANGSAWAASWNTYTPAGATLDIQSNKGRFLNTTGANANGPNAWLSSVAPAADYDISVDVFLMGGTTDQLVTLGGNSPLGYVNNGSVDDGYYVALLPGSSKFRLFTATSGTDTQIGADQSYTFPASGTGVTLHYKKVGTAHTVTLRTVGASEPTSGTGFFSASDAGANATIAGQPSLGMANGAASTATNVSFDNFSIT